MHKALNSEYYTIQIIEFNLVMKSYFLNRLCLLLSHCDTSNHHAHGIGSGQIDQPMKQQFANY